MALYVVATGGWSGSKLNLLQIQALGDVQQFRMSRKSGSGFCRASMPVTNHADRRYAASGATRNAHQRDASCAGWVRSQLRTSAMFAVIKPTQVSAAP